MTCLNKKAPRKAFCIISIALIGVALFPNIARAIPAVQEPADNVLSRTDRLIAQEIERHSQLEQNLRHLAANMPARLTGSPNMDAAAVWVAKKFQDYGLQAHIERIEIPHAWVRGHEAAEIISPVQRQVPIHSFGWSKPTEGAVAGNVLPMVGKTAEELRRYRGKVKGAIILDGRPKALPSGKPANSFLAVEEDQELKDLSSEQMRDRMQVLRELIAESPAAVLVDSGKARGLFNMGTLFSFVPTPVPMAFILHEDYASLFEMANRSAVSLRIDLEGSFSPAAASASFVIAEIPGASNSKEKVILEAHLDSWDLADGVLDNGVGAMAVLEVARSVQALNLKPDRTLIFLLSSGEEQHHFGIQAYLKNHSTELADIDGVLVLDGGTGAVSTISLGRLGESEPVFRKIYAPVAGLLHLLDPAKAVYSGSDHDEFLAMGIPAYICIQAASHYGEAHHSQEDTLKYFDRQGANQAAKVLGGWMWNASQVPERLPRPAKQF
jgi:hypothetical protein